MLRVIKYAYQRVVRGYDDRIKWGFSDYFNQCIPALKEFCEAELKYGREELNTQRIGIYRETLKRIKDFEDMSDEDYWKDENAESKLWEFVGKNIGWYWD